jgi:hypothetical protein
VVAAVVSQSFSQRAKMMIVLYRVQTYNTLNGQWKRNWGYTKTAPHTKLIKSKIVITKRKALIHIERTHSSHESILHHQSTTTNKSWMDEIEDNHLPMQP